MRTSSIVALLFLIVAGLLTACGPSEEELGATATQIAENIFATQTAEAPTVTNTPSPTPTATDTPTPTPTDTATPTPTPTPTNTPTITPTPTPDLAAATITVEELPPGFEELPPDVLDFFMGAGAAETFDDIFAFLSEDPLEILMGVTQRLTTEFEQNVADDQLQDPDYLAASAGTGLENAILEQNELSDIDDLGDVSGGVSLVVEEPDANLRVDLVAFRRGEVLVMVFSFYPDGETPMVDARDVARTVDQRLVGMSADL